MYWKEWLNKALSETRDVFGALSPKVLPPLLSPVFLYLEFGMGGLTSLSAWWKIAICLVESYAMAFVAIYVWEFIAVVPTMLEGRDVQVRQLTAQLLAEQNKAVAPEFKGEIVQLHMTSGNREVRDQQMMNISALVRVRYLGEQPVMSVHSVQLWMIDLELGSVILQGEPWKLEGGFWNRRGDFIFKPVEYDHAGKAQLKTTRWKFTFCDIFDNKYESEVFQQAHTA